MDLDSFFPYRLAVTSEAFSRNLAEVYGRQYGLMREEWRLLFLLAHADRLTSIELARRTTLDKVQVTRASQRLEAKGLITRRIPEADRRLREYACTDTGRALFAEALPQVRARAAAMLAALSVEDRAALEQGIRALGTVLNGGEDIGAPDARPAPSDAVAK
jgi:DNA-binding MarR family transcriptional regulator